MELVPVDIISYHLWESRVNAPRRPTHPPTSFLLHPSTDLADLLLLHTVPRSTPVPAPRMLVSRRTAPTMLWSQKTAQQWGRRMARTTLTMTLDCQSFVFLLLNALFTRVKELLYRETKRERYIYMTSNPSNTESPHIHQSHSHQAHVVSAQLC